MLKNIKNFFGRSKTPSERYKERYYEKKDKKLYDGDYLDFSWYYNKEQMLKDLKYFNLSPLTSSPETIEQEKILKDCQHDECNFPLCGCEAARKGYN